MELLLYKNFSKRRNSTKQPGDADATYDVKLKEETSIENPSWEISGTVDYSWTYAKFADHYYFITDIRLSRLNTYVISATQDVLATYKSVIGDYTAYIERSSASDDDRYADDLFARTITYKEVKTATDTIADTSSTGGYVLRTSGLSGIKNFAIAEETLNSVMNYINTQDNWNNIAGAISLNLVTHPTDYILSLKWLPVNVTFLGDVNTLGDIYWGYINTFVQAPYAYPSITRAKAIPVPDRIYNDWRDFSADWTTITLFLFGNTINIDPAWFSLGTIHYEAVIDVLTGNTRVKLLCKTSSSVYHLITVFNADFAAEQQVSNNQTNIMGGIVNAASAYFSGVSGDYAGLATQGSAAVKAFASPTASICGGIGAKAALIDSLNVVCTRAGRNYSVDENSYYGHPLYVTGKISDHAGYIKCSYASISGNMLDNDRTEINNYLNSGFYYE